jgi:hypothetical protein
VLASDGRWGERCCDEEKDIRSTHVGQFDKAELDNEALQSDGIILYKRREGESDKSEVHLPNIALPTFQSSN